MNQFLNRSVVLQASDMANMGSQCPPTRHPELFVALDISEEITTALMGSIQELAEKLKPIIVIGPESPSPEQMASKVPEPAKSLICQRISAYNAKINECNSLIQEITKALDL